MKKFKITKEQVLKIYDATSVNNQEELEQWFPNVFKKELNVGKWYKTESGCLFKLNEITDRFYMGFGFTTSMTYYYDFKEYIKTKLIEATEQEVKTALINEAKKRGFKKGAIVENQTVNSDEYRYYSDNTLYVSGVFKTGIEVFKNGKWATIIETITKEEAEKLLNKKII